MPETAGTPAALSKDVTLGILDSLLDKAREVVDATQFTELELAIREYTTMVGRAELQPRCLRHEDCECTAYCGDDRQGSAPKATQVKERFFILLRSAQRRPFSDGPLSLYEALNLKESSAVRGPTLGSLIATIVDLQVRRALVELEETWANSGLGIPVRGKFNLSNPGWVLVVL